MIKELLYSSGIAVAFLFTVNVGLDYRLRNHPKVLQARTRRLAVFSALALIFVNYAYDKEFFVNSSLLEVTGYRLESLTNAICLPLCLTMIFYLAPMVMHFIIDGNYAFLLEKNCWIEHFTDPLSLRDHIWAPIFEEVSFRSCVLPILYPVLGESKSAIVGPLLFGMCHLHHIFERTNRIGFKDAVVSTLCQCLITTLFGVYTSYIFLRTANILPCIVVHSFCNYMGLPTLPEKNQRWLWLLYMAGIGGWLFLLYPILGDRNLYSNNIFSD